MLPWFLVWYIHVHWIVNSPAYSQSTTTFHFFACVQVSCAWGCRFCESRLVMVVQHSFTPKNPDIYQSLHLYIPETILLWEIISISGNCICYRTDLVKNISERKLCPTILSYSYSRCKYFFVPDSLLISLHFIIHVYIYVVYGFNKHRIPLLLDKIRLF